MCLIIVTVCNFKCLLLLILWKRQQQRSNELSWEHNTFTLESALISIGGGDGQGAGITIEPAKKEALKNGDLLFGS